MIRIVLVALAVIALPLQAEARKARPVNDHHRILVLQELVYQLRQQARAAVGAPAFIKHAWPALTEEEKDDLAAVLRRLPKTVKFDIMCNDASCTDLAMDIDDVMESAGFESVLDHSLGPLGYGIALRVNAFDKEAAEAASAALKKATEGKFDLPVMEAAAGTNPAGYVSVLIGKYRAPAAAR